MTEKFIAHSHGILYTSYGQSYYLLKNHPIDRYPWQNDDQQMWYVVKRVLADFEVDEVYRPVGFAFQLVTSNPTIEFISEDIEVETVGLDESETENEQAAFYLGSPILEDEYVPDQQID